MTGLLKKLVRKGIKPKYLYFLYRVVLLKLTQGGRIFFSSLSVSLERTCLVSASQGSQISFGNWVYVKRGVDIEAHDGAAIKTGDNIFINKNCSLIARAGIEIGNNCMIADNVSIYDHNYNYSQPGVVYLEQGYNAKKITIGNNVWIGSKVFIGGGVTIGNNAIIGANTIVTKDVPANTLVHGQVGLVMKQLWTDESVAKS